MSTPEQSSHVNRRLSPERWAAVRAAAEAALDLPKEERSAFLDSACGADRELHDEVEQLIEACEQAAQSTGFLAEPATAFVAPIAAAMAARSGVVSAPMSAVAGVPAIASADMLENALRAALAGRYAVEREVGRGGMARVYLAHDSRHGRRVALKVLHPELRAIVGAERFLAEIQVMANLQHPNLLPLFDSGEAGGFLYYVMPYVEGESLRARLEREGQFPVAESVRLTTAVAGALDFAHRQGVVHRDLKPENILLHDGQPLVADFGIALALSRAGGERMTQTGLSLGTPAYMSPEQAAADRIVDARSDVYSLACVLYEMLTGDPPHTASSVQAIIAKVLTETPPSVRVRRPAVPPAVNAALERALSKLPADRFATAREFADALGDGRALSPSTTAIQYGDDAPRAHGVRRRLRDPVFLGVVAAAVLFGGIATWLLRGMNVGQRLGAAASSSPRTARFVVGSLVNTPIGGTPIITPDGRQLVYLGTPEDGRPVMVRALDQLQGRPVAGTEGATGAIVSPDGRWIAYFTVDDKLKKVPIDGGTPTLLAGVFRFNNSIWTRGGVIVTAAYGRQGLSWLPDSGGALHALTRLDSAKHESLHSAPIVTPDGQSVVFTVQQQRGGPGTTVGELAVVPLDVVRQGPGSHTLLGVNAGGAVAVIDGWLLYTGSASTTLMAVRFDARARRVTGNPIPVLQEREGIIDGVSLADDGTLVYTRRHAGNSPVLVDSRGVATPLLARPGIGPYMNPRLSPDGKRIALQAGSPQGSDVWVYELASGTSTRLTSSGNAYGPAWTPDSRRIVFLSTRSGRDAFWWQLADGSAPPEKLVEEDGVFSGSVAPDGRTLLFQRQLDNVWSIWSASLDGDHAPRAVLREAFDNYMPVLAPNGKWLAYASTASGQQEVHVRPFPGPGAPVQVSVDGGTEPIWARDGKRLFYRSGRQLVAAELSFSPAVAVMARTAVFDDVFESGMPHANYDVAVDGRRFVMVSAGAGAGTETVVVVDWLPEFRRLVAQRQ